MVASHAGPRTVSATSLTKQSHKSHKLSVRSVCSIRGSELSPARSQSGVQSIAWSITPEADTMEAP